MASSMVFIPGSDHGELVVPEVGLTCARRHDEAVVGVLVEGAGQRRRVDDTPVQVQTRDGREDDPHVLLFAQHLA